MTDSQGLPMNIPTQKPDDISTASTLSSSHSHKSRPRRNRSVKSNQDQQSEKSEFIQGYHDYADLDPEDSGEPIQRFTFKVKDSESVIRDRSLRAKPYTCRPKFDSAKWDGMSSSFSMFKRALEGHLLQVGAGYMTQPAFLSHYKELKTDYLKSDVFWNIHKISQAQSAYDREYLYGILVMATMKVQHKTIIKYQQSQDGILAWEELKAEFEYDGSKELCLEQLESLAQTPYTNSDAGGMASYIDKFQAYIAELEAIAPMDYSDFRKKRMLLANIRQASGVSHLIQKCRDDDNMTYSQCAAYLRKNAILIDHANIVKPPT